MSNLIARKATIRDRVLRPDDIEAEVQIGEPEWDPRDIASADAMPAEVGLKS